MASRVETSSGVRHVRWALTWMFLWGAVVALACDSLANGASGFRLGIDLFGLVGSLAGSMATIASAGK